jgi:hypothetical protein
VLIRFCPAFTIVRAVICVCAFVRARKGRRERERCRDGGIEGGREGGGREEGGRQGGRQGGREGGREGERERERERPIGLMRESQVAQRGSLCKIINQTKNTLRESQVEQRGSLRKIIAGSFLMFIFHCKSTYNKRRKTKQLCYATSGHRRVVFDVFVPLRTL